MNKVETTAGPDRQFVEGDLIIPDGISRITVGFNDEATEVCFIGHHVGGLMWLLGYRKIPGPVVAGKAVAATWNTAETPYLAEAGTVLSLPEAWKRTLEFFRGESSTVSEAAAEPPVRLWETAIVYRDGRPDSVLTPAGGVPEDEAISIYRTYRDSVDRADGVVGTFPAREA